MPMIDLTGRTYGDWTVIAYSHRDKNTAWWHVKCVCGTERTQRAWVLTTGKSTQCGDCSAQKLARLHIQRQADLWVGVESNGWTVLAHTGTVTMSGERITMWACQCTACGAVIDVPRTCVHKATMPVCRHGKTPATDPED